MIVQVQEILHAMMHATQRCLFTSLATASFRKVAFCLTGPYLTRRATIGRLANSPPRAPPWRGAVRLEPPAQAKYQFWPTVQARGFDLSADRSTARVC